MATLKVKNFDSRRNELTVENDKKHGHRRILLPQSTAALFANASRGKKAAQPIFTRQNGLPWDKDSWKKPVKAAVAAAGLPDETVLYTLRHSVITDLVQSGLDLLTIAQISGTSVAMIEKHYGHFRQHRAAEALESLALRAHP